MPLEERLFLADQPRGNMKGDRLQRVAVIEDHQRVVPVQRYIDAVGRAVEQSDLGDACR